MGAWGSMQRILVRLVVLGSGGGFCGIYYKGSLLGCNSGCVGAVRLCFGPMFLLGHSGCLGGGFSGDLCIRALWGVGCLEIVGT